MIISVVCLDSSPLTAPWGLNPLKKKITFHRQFDDFCLSSQNFGGGMRPPHNTMGPGMPGVNM